MSARKFMKLAFTALENNLTVLEHPYKLTFSITYWCQSKCLICNIWQMKPKGELSLEEVREFAIRNPYFKWIEITGGEPFLRGDIVEIVRAFKENCKDLYIVTIPTNSLCNQEMVVSRIREMLELGLPKISITVSLDGYRELHDRLRGVQGNFDKAIGLYKELKELKKSYRNLFFVFGYTISKYNQGLFERTFEGVKRDIPDITYNDFHINVGQTSSIYYSNPEMDIKASKEMLAGEIRNVIKNRRRQFGAIPQIESAFLRKLVDYIMNERSPMRSKSLDASLFLDSYGNVYPSIMWGRKVGNIRESSYRLEGLWHNEEATEIRRLIKEGKEPTSWTACEAYQTLVGNIASLLI